MAEAPRRVHRAPDLAPQVHAVDGDQASSRPALPTAAAGAATPSLVRSLVAGPPRPGRGFDASRAEMLLALQGTVGNRAVHRAIQRAAAPEPVARPGSEDAAPTPPLAERIRAASNGGAPLPPTVQQTLEGTVGADLSALRVHTDGEADRLARAVDATAFTTGRDVFFRAGAYAPSSAAGLHLLTHEATHVVQQAAGPVAGTVGPDGLAVSDPGDPFEQAAEAAATTGGAARPSAPLATHVEAGPTVQRQQPAPATVDVRDLPMADQDQEAIRKAARDNLPIWADTFANLWYSANNGALGATAEPDDPDFASESGVMAKAAFGIALAGNLVWAATCLMPPVAAVAIAAMSFGGAAVGSGAVPMIGGGEPPKSTQPSFKLAAAAALAQARDRLSQAGKGVVKDVADDCAAGNVSDIEEQKQRLWAKLFSTGYNQAEPIEAAAAAKLATAGPSFVAQWRAHKNSKEVQDEAWRRTTARIERDGYPWSVRLRILIEPSGPGGPADEYKLQVYNEEWPKYAAETFKPNLSFS